MGNEKDRGIRPGLLSMFRKPLEPCGSATSHSGWLFCPEGEAVNVEKDSKGATRPMQQPKAKRHESDSSCENDIRLVYPHPFGWVKRNWWWAGRYLNMEDRTGIEPALNGFAAQCVATPPPVLIPRSHHQTLLRGGRALLIAVLGTRSSNNTSQACTLHIP